METSVDGARDGSPTESPRGYFVVRVFKTMSAHRKELCFILAIMFTAYAALHNSPPKTQKASLPNRFFPWNSLVSDYQYGDIHKAFDHITESDLTFVMFYAPWDATSMAARWEFDRTARYFYQQVRFVAINCWWPEGECRHHFRHIQSYPVLVAYPGIGRGVHYRGPLVMPHMVYFLEKMMQPLKTIFNELDLISLRAKHDTVVVTFVDFEESAQPTHYLSFYAAALKALEKDATQCVCFAVVSRKATAQDLGLDLTLPSAVLFRFNETVDFPSEKAFRSDEILKWVFDERQPAAEWLSPPGVKSRLLSNILETSNPALIMFTPRNPLQDGTPYFEMLNEVAMDYYNCNNSTEVQDLIEQSELLRTIHRISYKQAEENCKSWENRDEFHDSGSMLLGVADQMFPNSTSCCQSVVVQTMPKIVEVRRRCDVCVHAVHRDSTVAPANSAGGSSDGKRRLACQLLNKLSDSRSSFRSMLEDVIQSVVDVCKEFMYKFSPAEIIVACCRKVCSGGCGSAMRSFHPYGKGSLAPSYEGADDKMEELLGELDSQRCRRRRVAMRYSRLDFPIATEWTSGYQYSDGFSGLGCRTNKSLQFVAMDTLQYGVFTKNFGVNISEHQHRTAVLIHNTQQEVQHLLRSLVTQTNLVEFIQNYTEGFLSRHLRSAQENHSSCSRDDPVCIQDVTSETFRSVVLDNTKDVVLLYYTSWCGFCSAIAHVFLSVALYFQPMKNILFRRISGEKNDLPWEFNAEKYPTILFFPAQRKSESRKYPVELPFTTPNLINFVVANMASENRLEMALNLCSSACIAYNRHRLLVQIREYSHNVGLLSLRHRHAIRSLQKLPVNDLGRKQLKEYMLHVGDNLHRARIKLQHVKMLHVTLIGDSNSKLSDSQKRVILANHRHFKWDLRYHTASMLDAAGKNKDARGDDSQQETIVPVQHS